MQAVLANQIGSQAGKITLGQERKAIKKLARDDAVKDGVAEELEPLVVRQAVAAVRECGQQQGSVYDERDMIVF